MSTPMNHTDLRVVVTDEHGNALESWSLSEAIHWLNEDAQADGETLSPDFAQVQAFCSMMDEIRTWVRYRLPKA